jgi:LAO/AO transport system kinase
MARAVDVPALVKGVLDGSRATLARAITLVESHRPDHRAAAQELLQELLPRAGEAHRVGISGVPGVGKSTFVAALGTRLTGSGHRVAVLAVDPVHPTGGSILGDKTRMEHLAVDENAFVRPSPSAGTLGGVARHAGDDRADGGRGLRRRARGDRRGRPVRGRGRGYGRLVPC